MSFNSTPTILPSTAAPIVDDVFLRFKDAGRSTVIIAFTSIRIIMALACMLLNAILVIVTVKRRNLREIFNILIAWNSVACFCYMFAYVNHFIIAIFGWNFIPVRQCFFMMLLPIFAAQSLHVSFLAIATDRLLCVLFPLWHRNFLQANSKSYVILIICLVSLYSLIGLLSGIQYSQFVIPEKLVGCATSDGVPQIVFQVTLYYNILTLIFYILLWILMKFKNIEDSLSNTTKRTQKSLIIIFLIEFSGSFTNNLIKQITIWAALSAYDQWFVMNIAGLLLVPTLAMNAPVLFIRNLEYGRAFFKVFGIKFPFSKFVTSATITNGGKMVWTSNLNS